MWSHQRRDSEWITGKTLTISTKKEQGGKSNHSLFYHFILLLSLHLYNMHISLLTGAGTGMLLIGDRVILPLTALTALDQYIKPGEQVIQNLNVLKRAGMAVFSFFFLLLLHYRETNVALCSHDGWHPCLRYPFLLTALYIDAVIPKCLHRPVTLQLASGRSKTSKTVRLKHQSSGPPF